MISSVNRTPGGGETLRRLLSEDSMTIETLSLDIETRSGADLAKAGVYRYAESEDFDILLFGVSVNHGPVTVYDLACGETVPEEILRALTDPAVLKSAYNSSFERICLSRWLRRNRPDLFGGAYLDPSSWQCTMVWGAYNGLPFGLERIGAALGLEEQKLTEGKDLIRYFCRPCKPTAASGGQCWHLPEHAPEKWERFKAYNRRDVEVELAIQDRLSKHPVPDSVWEEYHLDQEINDRGIRIDRELVRQAIRMDELSKNDLTARLRELTGLENPNSVAQLKRYLADHGIQVDSLGRKEAEELIRTVPEEVGRMLKLRLQLAKSSVSKYRAMENCVCADGRCRGLFQFLGASRTGRWAGRLIQLQNLPQNHLPDLEQARDLVKQGDYETLSLLYESVPAVLSELIRTAFIPENGAKFIVCDYSAVEARCLSFLAGEQWRIHVFHEGGDIYCETASRMFRVPVVKNGENGHLRQKGKIAELALGYGGSIGALTAMGALDMGISEWELGALVDRWRDVNPHIVLYWREVDQAAVTAVMLRVPQHVGKVRFRMNGEALSITLPSGRQLAYLNPQMKINDFGRENLTYLGTDLQKRWTRIETYGAKLVENITQAICRDLLAYAMWNLQDYRTVAHVHDEVILEVPPNTSVETVCAIMGRTPPWLPGLELRAEGFEAGFYRK